MHFSLMEPKEILKHSRQVRSRGQWREVGFESEDQLLTLYGLGQPVNSPEPQPPHL